MTAAWYLDTSALVKQVVVESESAGFCAWLSGHLGHVFTSALSCTELLRAVRWRDPGKVTAARQLLDEVYVIDLTREILEHAGSLDPSQRRSLDAIHLATAIWLGSELDGVVTYDSRMAAAATAQGLTVIAPTA